MSYDFIPWVYIYRSNHCLFIDKQALSPDHWAYDYILDIKTEEFKLDSFNSRPANVKLPNCLLKQDVQLCDYYSIKHNDHPIVYDNIALSFPRNGKQTSLIPLNMVLGHDQLLLQIKTYESSLEFDKPLFSLDKADLLAWYQTTKKRPHLTIIK
jgi:hypothetical protein